MILLILYSSGTRPFQSSSTVRPRTAQEYSTTTRDPRLCQHDRKIAPWSRPLRSGDSEPMRCRAERLRYASDCRHPDTPSRIPKPSQQRVGLALFAILIAHRNALVLVFFHLKTLQCYTIWYKIVSHTWHVVSTPTTLWYDTSDSVISDRYRCHRPHKMRSRTRQSSREGGPARTLGLVPS